MFPIWLRMYCFSNSSHKSLNSNNRLEVCRQFLATWNSSVTRSRSSALYVHTNLCWPCTDAVNLWWGLWQVATLIYYCLTCSRVLCVVALKNISTFRRRLATSFLWNGYSSRPPEPSIMTTFLRNVRFGSLATQRGSQRSRTQKINALGAPAGADHNTGHTAT